MKRVDNADEDTIEPIIKESEALKGDHQLVHTTTQKVISSLLKMEQDEFGRLSLRLRVLRACRLFVSQTAIEALTDDDDGEIRFLRILRTCQEGKDLYKSIKDQLITYKELAEAECSKIKEERVDRWTFFKKTFFANPSYLCSS